MAGEVHGVCFSANASYLAAGVGDSNVYIQDTEVTIAKFDSAYLM